VATSADYEVSSANFPDFDPRVKQADRAFHLNWDLIQLGDIQYLDRKRERDHKLARVAASTIGFRVPIYLDQKTRLINRWQLARSSQGQAVDLAL
jgi:hypothetical protein